MLSPTPGTTTILGTSNIPFQWSTGVGITSYELLIGTNGAGTSNILNTGALNTTSYTVPTLPADGVDAFVRLEFAHQRSLAERRLRLHRERNGNSRHALTLFGSALNQPDLYLEQRQRGDLLQLKLSTNRPGSPVLLDTGVTMETSATVGIPANAGRRFTRCFISLWTEPGNSTGLHFYCAGDAPELCGQHCRGRCDGNGLKLHRFAGGSLHPA